MTGGTSQTAGMFHNGLIPKIQRYLQDMGARFILPGIKWKDKKKKAYYYTEDGRRHYKHRCNLRRDDR
jgi:hypothetical protein